MNDKEHLKQTILCPSCLTENDVLAHFCQKCNTPLDNYATTAPFERISAKGNLLLKVTKATTKEQLIMCYFYNIWFPIFFIAFIIMAFSDLRENLFRIILSSPFACFNVIVIKKAHKHYKKHKLETSSDNNTNLSDDFIECIGEVTIKDFDILERSMKTLGFKVIKAKTGTMDSGVVVLANQEKLIEITKDRGQWMIAGDKNKLESMDLWRAFEDTEEFKENLIKYLKMEYSC